MSQTSIVADFNRLATAFPVDIPATFEGTRGKPLVFPSTDVNPPTVEVKPKQLKVVLRSIRAPKFSVEYNINSNNTVFSLKERLITDPNSPLGSEHSLSSIKLLLKAKALNDTKILSDLPSTELTVMLSSATSQDNFVPSQVYWPGDSEAVEAAGSKPAPAAVPEAQKVKAAVETTDEALLKDLEKVLLAHGRQDLIEKIRSIV